MPHQRGSTKGRSTREDATTRVPALTNDDIALLRALATGASDATTATRLGTSARTIRRRVAVLGQTLGVKGRFALGLAIGRLGLIGNDPERMTTIPR